MGENDRSNGTKYYIRVHVRRDPEKCVVKEVPMQYRHHEMSSMPGRVEPEASDVGNHELSLVGKRRRCIEATEMVYLSDILL